MKNIALLLLIPFLFLVKNIAVAQDCPTFWSSNAIVQSGDTARLDIRVKDFNSILAVQYTMDFDPSKLEFIEIGNFNLPDLLISNFGIFPDDRITFSWLDNTLSGLSIPDSTIIYSVWFKVLHPNGTSSTLSFENEPTPIEVVQLLPDGDHYIYPSFIIGEVFANANSGLAIPSIETICAIAESCAGGNSSNAINLELSGGSPPYSFLWTNDLGNSYSTEDLENVPQGVYHLTVTDQNNEQASALVLLFDEEQINFGLSFNLVHPSCGQANGAIELTLPNPDNFSFSWSTGSTNQSIANLAAGQYQVTVTNNSSGCQEIQSVELAEESLLASSTYHCQFLNDDMVEISYSVVVWAGGTPPYTFEWSDGSTETDSIFSTLTVTNLISDPQTYSVTITDAGGCATEVLNVASDCNPGGDGVEISTIPTNVEVGESFCVDLTVSDFTDILSMQFSVHWDPTIIQFNAIDNYSLPNGTGSDFGDPDILGPGTLTFAWLDHSINGVSLPNGSTIFQICFTAIGPGISPINITDTPTLMEVIEVGQNEIPLNSFTNNVIVSGEVNNNVVFQTEAPTCGQANGSIDVLLNEPGDYSFNWSTGANTQNLSNLMAGQYEVTVTENTSGDQSIHLVDLQEADFIPGTSYECEIFADNTVNIDLHALVWSGGRAPYTFTWSDGSVQTDSLLSTITVSSSLSESPSYSVTVSDATGCVYEPIVLEPNCGNIDGLTLNASEEAAEIGETICLDISASGFNDVVSLQFSMNWDASHLEFVSLQGFNLPDLSLNNFNEEAELADGTLRFSWLDNTTQGITLSENTTLFQLCLTAIDGPANVPVNFSNEPILQEATNGDLGMLDITTNDGVVIISGGNGGNNGEIQLLIGEDIGIPGQEVCLPVTCENFTDVVSMQFSINWDPAIIEYSDIIIGDLPALSLSNFGLLGTEDGEIRVSWVDQGATGINLPDGTPLFEICFVPPGPPGIGIVEFTNDPIPIEFIDGDTNPLDFLGSAGQVTVPANLVWPGDTDQSEAVNHFDLLNIGLAFGSMGPSRENASIDWEAQYTTDWDLETTETNINFKHADSDGNGIVNAEDTLAIIQNWGEITEFWENEEDQFGNPEESDLVNPPIYVLPDTIIPGETVDFSIILGNNNIPANEIYGLAFTIVYDPEVIVENSVGAHFTESWMGDVSSNLLGIYRDNFADNKVDIAITRTDLNNVSGQGMIGSLRVTIEDVIFRRSEQYELKFEIENVRLIDVQEADIPVSSPASISIIVDQNTNTNIPEWANSIELYPIPAKNWLYLDTGTLAVEALNLFSVEGKLLKQFNTQQHSMNLSNLPGGTYLLQIITDKGVVTRRIEKL